MTADQVHPIESLCGTPGHEGRNAIARLTWTVYGGALKYRNACESCVQRVQGQVGMEIKPINGKSVVPCPHVAAGAKRFTYAETTMGNLGAFCRTCASAEAMGRAIAISEERRAGS